MADADALRGAGIKVASTVADVRTVDLRTAAEAELPKSLALAAIDEAFQERVKHLFDVATTAAAVNIGDLTEAIGRAHAGYQASVMVRNGMRKMVSEA
jgi:hypothetical protein